MARRDLSSYMDWPGAAIQACALHLLGPAGFDVRVRSRAQQLAGAPLVVDFYCCSIFAASRQAIERVGRNGAWERVLAFVEDEGCARFLPPGAPRGRRWRGQSLEGTVLEHVWHIAFGLPRIDGWGGERGAGYPWSDRCDFFACGPLCPDPGAVVEGDEADGYAFSYLDVVVKGDARRQPRSSHTAVNRFEFTCPFSEDISL